MGVKQTRTDRPNVLFRLGEGAAEDFNLAVPEVYRPSGIVTLDRMILGAVAGELLLIAGAPSQGKTALAVQWLVTNAQEGTPSAILSMEMSRRSLRNRLVSGLTGIDMQTLRTRNWASPGEKANAIEAAVYLAEIPLYVDDRTGLDAGTVYSTLMSWKAHGIGLGVVDYIQQMSGASDSRVTQVGDAVRAIKAAAKDADMPIIALSATNRAAASDNRTPRLSDMRDSGDLEFVADTVLAFHYPDGEDRMQDIRVCDIHVLKQRNGPTGIASTKFNRPATTFEAM